MKSTMCFPAFNVVTFLPFRCMIPTTHRWVSQVSQPLPDYLHVLPLLVLILILILDVNFKRDRSQLVLTFPPSPSTSSVMFPSHALVSLILSTR